jgi:hypothetical protein
MPSTAMRREAFTMRAMSSAEVTMFADQSLMPAV